MQKEIFNKHYQTLLRKASAVRSAKEAEYFSEHDLLGNFRKLANFRNRLTPQVIMDLGMKSIHSLSDMVDAECDGQQPFSDKLWDEKFVDALNYIVKLYAAVMEQRGK